MPAKAVAAATGKAAATTMPAKAACVGIVPAIIIPPPLYATLWPLPR